jgi:hypothetical protein
VALRGAARYQIGKGASVLRRTEPREAVEVLYRREERVVIVRRIDPLARESRCGDDQRHDLWATTVPLLPHDEKDAAVSPRC